MSTILGDLFRFRFKASIVYTRVREYPISSFWIALTFWVGSTVAFEITPDFHPGPIMSELLGGLLGLPLTGVVLVIALENLARRRFTPVLLARRKELRHRLFFLAVSILPTYSSYRIEFPGARTDSYAIGVPDIGLKDEEWGAVLMQVSAPEFSAFKAALEEMAGIGSRLSFYHSSARSRTDDHQPGPAHQSQRPRPLMVTAALLRARSIRQDVSLRAEVGSHPSAPFADWESIPQLLEVITGVLSRSDEIEEIQFLEDLSYSAKRYADAVGSAQVHDERVEAVRAAWTQVEKRLSLVRNETIPHPSVDPDSPAAFDAHQSETAGKLLFEYQCAIRFLTLCFSVGDWTSVVKLKKNVLARKEL